MNNLLNYHKAEHNTFDAGLSSPLHEVANDCWICCGRNGERERKLKAPMFPVCCAVADIYVSLRIPLVGHAETKLFFFVCLLGSVGS